MSYPPDKERYYNRVPRASSIISALRYIIPLIFFLPEQLQDRLLALTGEGERLDAELLAHLQGDQVGAFLVDFGQGELAGAVLQ